MEMPIPNIIKEVLDAVGISYTDITEEVIAGQSVFQIVTDDKVFSGGIGGDIVRALDHLIKRIIEQRGLPRINFVVDVNGYQVSRIRELEMKARMMADRAQSLQYDVELEPMSSYERLIVHSILSDVAGIRTESLGEGWERRIVIRYVGELAPTPEEIL